MAVNDRFISGGIINSGINRTWLLSEAIPGGSVISLELAWNSGEEQSMFNRAMSEVIRSNGTSIVEHSPTDSAIGNSPYFRAANSFVTLNEFSVASYTAVTALAVKLKSFTAYRLNNTSVNVVWETSAQNETPLYTVERSADGNHFIAIGTVNGQVQKTNYSFMDKNSNAPLVWYRLHIKTQDGTTSYSRTVQVNGMSGMTQMQLRPSVTPDEITTLYLFLVQKEHIILHLADASGRILSEKFYLLQPGEHYLPIKLDRLSKGMYYVHVIGSNPGMVKTLPLIKQ
jgi:hypothetical protein